MNYETELFLGLALTWVVSCLFAVGLGIYVGDLWRGAELMTIITVVLIGAGMIFNISWNGSDIDG